jgi:pimeloyl-ACP methyl ester carboxylesterase
VTTRKTPAPESGSVHESFALAPDGTRLYVRSRPGPSPLTAVLCDGLVCDGFIYKYLWDDLGRSLSVAHFNYRGHGRSATPVDPARIDVPAHAADLDAVRQHIGDPEVVLVGHSLGTQVVLEAYRRRPDKVRALVLLNGSFGRVTYTFKGSDLLANVLPNMIDFASRHPKLLRALWTRLPVRMALKVAELTGDIDAKAVSAEDMEPYFRHAVHVDFEMFVRMLRHAGEHSAEEFLGSIAVPTLIVAGSRDSFTPPSVSEAMAELMPHATLDLIPGGTHVVPLEQRQRVIEKVEAFLRKANLIG